MRVEGWLTENDELSLERNFVSATYQCSNQMKTRLENSSEYKPEEVKSGYSPSLYVSTVSAH